MKPEIQSTLAAIVHHVELNRAGWWDKAVQRLVLAAIWSFDKPITIDKILLIIKNEFSLVLSEAKIDSAINGLETQNVLVRLSGSKFRISDEQRTVFEKEISDAETVERNARIYFSNLIKELCEDLDPDESWNIFESKLLVPFIQEIGANAYRLIAGESLTASQRLVDQFIDYFEPHLETSLKQVVTRFLDPKKDEVRKYVSRMLHAVFCIEASGLSEDVIKKVSTSSGKQIRFRILVDTNFLFSILDLHDNPSNTAAREINELIAKLKTNPKIDLFITTLTVDEAKHSISLAKDRLVGLPKGMNFTRAALQADFSGMTKRFLEERIQRNAELTVDDWFDPYLNDLVLVARGKGIELFNERLDSYATDQDVVDDILLVKGQEKKRNEKFRRNRFKTYETIKHDMILWHLVKDKRPAYVESPVDAEYWILTLDYRLIGFDEQKQKQANSNIPICVHPTSLIQLLQFWMPRTKEFEEAILGSMRLPFLFHEFDTEAERTSLRILEGIGRFEDSDQYSEETISQVMLNEGLRARINSEENGTVDSLELIQDTLLEELNTRVMDEANRAQEINDILKDRDMEVSALKSELNTRTIDEADRVQKFNDAIKDRDMAISAFKSEVADKGGEVEQLKTKIEKKEEEGNTALRKVENLEKKWQEQEETKEVRWAFFKYLAFLVSALLASGSAFWWLSAQIVTQAFVGIAIFLFFHLILESWIKSEKSRISELWPFRQIRRFRKGLWSSLIAAVIAAVIVEMIENDIQQLLQ